MSEILIIVLLIFCNGLLSMTEIALVSVRKSSLEQKVKQGSRSARIASDLAGDPDKFLSTIQIGITVIGILTGIYSGNVLAQDFAQVLASVGIPEAYNAFLSKTIIVVVVTYFTIVFGELVPKRIGMNMSESVALWGARPMAWLSTFTHPFVSVLSRSTAFIVNLTGLKSGDAKVTTEEIKSMIAEGRKGGEVEAVEQDIVDRVFLLGDLKVSSVMTQRSEMVYLEKSMSLEKVKHTVLHHLYKCYPVVDKSLDDVKGVITLRSLLLHWEESTFALNQYVEEPAYFHENMSFYTVFEEMKIKRINAALICDEFGSCVGMITMKDILKGLVGAFDEQGIHSAIVQRHDGEGWLVDGMCLFHDFLSYFDQEELYDDQDYTTVAGLVLNSLGHIPQEGETLVWEGFVFEIIDMDGVRIDKVLVTKNQVEA